MSISKGSVFENRVRDWMEREIQAGKFMFLPGSCSTPVIGKAFPSRDRGRPIKFDVTSEVRLDNAAEWSVLLACECKNHSTPIPPREIEQFKAKLDQVTGANRKGLFAVTTPLQPAALNYARTYGIAVIIFSPQDSIVDKPFSHDEVKWAVREPQAEYGSPIMVGNQTFHDLEHALQYMFQQDSH